MKQCDPRSEKYHEIRKYMNDDEKYFRILRKMSERIEIISEFESLDEFAKYLPFFMQELEEVEWSRISQGKSLKDSGDEYFVETQHAAPKLTEKIKKPPLYRRLQGINIPKRLISIHKIASLEELPDEEILI